MNRHKVQSEKLRKNYRYNWDETTITYLGIKLTYPSSKLYDVNFPKLLEQTSKDLHQIQKAQLSWVGKTAAFKMQILFIWNGKKPRVAFSILTANKDLGGMGLPDIRNYHYASLLDQMKFWFTSPNDKLWLNIEK